MLKNQSVIKISNKTTIASMSIIAIQNRAKCTCNTGTWKSGVRQLTQTVALVLLCAYRNYGTSLELKCSFYLRRLFHTTFRSRHSFRCTSNIIQNVHRCTVRIMFIVQPNNVSFLKVSQKLLYTEAKLR